MVKNGLTCVRVVARAMLPASSSGPSGTAAIIGILAIVGAGIAAVWWTVSTPIAAAGHGVQPTTAAVTDSRASMPAPLPLGAVPNTIGADALAAGDGSSGLDQRIAMAPVPDVKVGPVIELDQSRASAAAAAHTTKSPLPASFDPLCRCAAISPQLACELNRYRQLIQIPATTEILAVDAQQKTFLPLEPSPLRWKWLFYRVEPWMTDNGEFEERMTGVMNALLIALTTGRAFGIDWSSPEPLTSALEPLASAEGLKWLPKIPDWLGNPHHAHRLRPVDWINSPPAGGGGGGGGDDWWSSLANDRVDIISLRSKSDVIIQKFVPLLASSSSSAASDSPLNQAWKRFGLPAKPDAKSIRQLYSCWYQILFSPSAKLTERLDSAGGAGFAAAVIKQSECTPPPSKPAAAQNQPQPPLFCVVLNKTPKSSAIAPADRVSAACDALQSKLAASPKSRILAMTDDAAVMEAVNKRYGGDTLISGLGNFNPAFKVDRTPSYTATDTEKAQSMSGWLRIVAAHFALGACDAVATETGLIKPDADMTTPGLTGLWRTGKVLSS